MIIGLDVACTMGVAIYNNGIVFHEAFLSPYKGHYWEDRERFRRWYPYVERVRQLVQSHGVTAAYIEGYSFASSNGVVLAVELGTLLRLELTALQVPWREVPPSTLKKFCTGVHNTPKSQMVLAVFKRFGVECLTHDEADAVALAYFGAYHSGLLKGDATKFMADAVKAIDKTKH